MSFLNRLTRPMLFLLAAGVLALSGCGEKVDVRLEGKEGERINIGDLVYQVQLSRILNPHDTEDEAYTRGLPQPDPSELYYGVFMRVDNEESDTPRTPIPIESMKVVDAGGKEYEPIEVDAPGLVYEPTPIGKGERVPIPDSAADNYPTRGGLILFKIPIESLENRPVKLEMEGPGGADAEVDLDV
jgi:hypothetical protein